MTKIKLFHILKIGYVVVKKDNFRMSKRTSSTCFLMESDIRQDILTGRLLPGDLILSEKELMTKYNLGRNSVRKVLDNLVNANLLTKVHGKGTLVANVNENEKLKDNPSTKQILFLSLATAMGYSSFRSANTLGPIFDGLNKVLSPLGYNILLTQINLDWKAPACLVKKEIDGVIFHGKMDSSFFQKYIKDLPNIGIQYQQVELNTNFVSIDNYAFSKMAVNYLYSLGHRKIGFVTDEINNQISYERFLGFKRSMEELNLPTDPNFLVTWQREYTNGQLVCEENIPDYTPYLTKAFQNPSSQPTAFVCVDDWRAKFTEIALNKMNLTVPKNISLIGSDNTVACKLNNYTGFSCMLDVVSKIAAKQLLEKITNPSESFLTTTLVKPEFISGNSVMKLKHN